MLCVYDERVDCISKMEQVFGCEIDKKWKKLCTIFGNLYNACCSDKCEITVFSFL